MTWKLPIEDPDVNVKKITYYTALNWEGRTARKFFEAIIRWTKQLRLSLGRQPLSF